MSIIHFMSNFLGAELIKSNTTMTTTVAPGGGGEDSGETQPALGSGERDHAGVSGDTGSGDENGNILD